MKPSENLMKVLLVGDYPPPYGGVSVHVEVVHQAVRAQGGICQVLDVGKGHLPADGVVPATGYLACAAHLARYALRGYRIHVHTSGANPKSWMLASVCAAAGRLSPQPPIVTFHSGLGPEWLAADPMRAKIACAVTNAFGNVIAVSDEIRGALLACGVSGDRIEVLPAFSPSFLHPGTPPPGLREIRAEASPLYCAMLAPGPVYGKETLLRAFGRIHAQNSRARLVVYGPGTELMGAEVAQLCGEAAASAVHAFGELHRPSALALIAASDVFVRPTLADGDSVSVREAVALGRAVVASSVGTRPPEARLVPPGDVDALAAALLEAAQEHPSLRVAPAPETAAKTDCLQRLLELYSGATGAPGTASNAPAAEPAVPARPAKTNDNTTTLVENPACAASVAS
ncbi:MAG: glycosyltransferase family 4 protein [Deltaproteobacteria bacterium]|nr:MAG: glycosyltransferase family 4 protein [Deltaproteobacteria bacterium]